MLTPFLREWVSTWEQNGSRNYTVVSPNHVKNLSLGAGMGNTVGVLCTPDLPINREPWRNLSGFVLRCSHDKLIFLFIRDQ